MKGEIGEI
jgi:hypothetical protein